MRPECLSLALLLLLTPIAGSVAQAAPMTRGTATRSDVCGECHTAIYNAWSTSLHARSMEDPVFLQAWKETKSTEGVAVSNVCLECHAPLAAVLKDAELKLKVTWEGVTCDYCHSITGVDTTQATPRLTVDIGNVKRGPFKDAVPVAHEVAYQPIHETSLACAPCHEFANAEGTPLMTTWTEWKNSSQARAGKACQDCHMGRQEADVVDPVVARVPEHRVNLHDVPGSNSVPMLARALKVAFDSHREGDSLIVELKVINKGAGHSVPTGMPGRRVFLNLSLTSGKGKTHTAERLYTKTFRDSEDHEIRLDSGFFAEKVRLMADTRIRADEQRVERFSFPVPPGVHARANVKLHYEHAPTGNDENRVWRTFFSQDFSVPAGGK